MLNHLPCGYLEFDDNGLLKQVNDRFCEMVDYSGEELISKHIKAILTPGAAVFYETHVFPLIKMEGHVNEIYITLLSNKGTKVPVLINAERSKKNESDIIRCIVVKMERRSEYEDHILYAKKRAEKSRDDKEQLFSMISHELRSPLGVILGMIKILSRDLDSEGNEDIAQYLNVIETASKNLARLAEDILNFAKLETGNFSINLKVIPLEKVLNNIFLMAKIKSEDKDIALIRGQTTNLKIYADPDRLQQILMNLLTNAIKFTESGGTIELTTEQSDQHARIHVKDSGVGIPDDKIEQIFQPFEQISNTYSGTDKSGFGLGLSISRKLSREMGGDLTVSSTPGKGTVFTLHLQLHDE